nr:CDP-glycerol glycerophosphotransferase family protein [Jeotgalibacillus malaysiensis]
MNLKHVAIKLVLYVLRLYPIKQNRIFFMSYYGQQYGGNPKYISDYFIKNDRFQRFDLVWGVSKTTEFILPPRIKKVRLFSFKTLRMLATSKVIITNYRLPDYFIKREGQHYIQTWHSSLRLKKVEKDAEAALPASYVKMAKRDSKHTDLILSGSRFSTETIRRAFWYKGDILESGMPRNDMLLQQNELKKKEIKLQIGASNEAKLLLYAPTFRKTFKAEDYKLDYSMIQHIMEQKTGDKWTILVRLHPHLIQHSKDILSGKDVIDATAYPDIQELLAVADICITDYSSLMFDYMITKKPCFLFVPDLETYKKDDRGLYFTPEELPFPIFKKAEDLLGLLQEFDQNQYRKKVQQFTDSVGSYDDGTAARQVYEHIDNICFRAKRSEWNEAI